jgi:hypothetical protein
MTEQLARFSSQSDGFSAHCALLLKDKKAADAWFAADRPVSSLYEPVAMAENYQACRHCCTRHATCERGDSHPSCSHCLKRKVKCSLKEDFLYNHSARFCGGDRQIFDAERAKLKISRPRPNKPKTEPTTPDPEPDSPTYPLTHCSPLAPECEASFELYKHQHMATDGDITVPNQVNGNTPDLHFSVDVAMASVSEGDCILTFIFIHANTLSGERSPPTIPREYKSVAVQAAVLSDSAC